MSDGCCMAGRLGGQGVRVAARLCTAVFEGDLPLLRRLLEAGAPPDACDYDKRTALHISAAEGNLAAVSAACCLLTGAEWPTARDTLLNDTASC